MTFLGKVLMCKCCANYRDDACRKLQPLSKGYIWGYIVGVV